MTDKVFYSKQFCNHDNLVALFLMVILRTKEWGASAKLHRLYSPWDVKGWIENKCFLPWQGSSWDSYTLRIPPSSTCALCFTLEKTNTRWVKERMALYSSGKRSHWSKEKQLSVPKSSNIKRQKTWCLSTNRTDCNTFEYPLALCSGNSFGYLRSAQTLSCRRESWTWICWLPLALHNTKVTAPFPVWNQDFHTLSFYYKCPDTVTFHFVVNGMLNRMG